VQPTIATSENAVLEDFLMATANELRDLIVPVYSGAGPMVLDGTGFEMTVGNSFAVAAYHWTESPPDSWLVLDRWATQWIRKLRSMTSANTDLFVE
jgi:hypothetical protein